VEQVNWYVEEVTRAGGGTGSSDGLGNCRKVFSLRSFANENGACSGICHVNVDIASG
jgi:hypothetical protein